MRIDIIIPAYKAQDTIIRTLSSIAMQTIKDDVDVTIVNDCDGVGYEKYVDMFRDHLSVRELTMPENGGPGDSRQYGIDNTSNPLITFIDADDVFSDPFALDTLREGMLKDPANSMVVGSFFEENGDNLIQHSQDLVWMFGKVYKRDFIAKHNIRFPKGLRANEDMCFNKQCLFYSNDNEKIAYIPNNTYYWMFRSDSITRVNNYEYKYSSCFTGMVDAWKYAITTCKANGGDLERIRDFAIDSLGALYAHYIQIEQRRNDLASNAWNKCVDYYLSIIKDYRNSITLDEFYSTYEKHLKSVFVRGHMYKCLPNITFRQFIRDLDKELDKAYPDLGKVNK